MFLLLAVSCQLLVLIQGLSSHSCPLVALREKVVSIDDLRCNATFNHEACVVKDRQSLIHKFGHQIGNVLPEEEREMLCGSGEEAAQCLYLDVNKAPGVEIVWGEWSQWTESGGTNHRTRVAQVTDGVQTMSCSQISQTDSCEGLHCDNGGACRDEVNGFTCDCLPGFTGKFCETEIDECVSSPCLNGGSCRDGINYYTCTSGFAGTRCETDIDECVSSPCLNGGSCRVGINYYTCTCVYGFAGTRCETVTKCVHGPYGVDQGVTVNEERLYLQYGPISGVKLWCENPQSGGALFGIQFQYGGREWGQWHGMEGPAAYEVYWGTGVRITEIIGRQYGAYIASIGFKTNTGHVYGPYGGQIGSDFLVMKAYQLHYAIVQMSGNIVGSINFVFRCAE